MNGYTEYFFWSIGLGADAVRLSIHDEHGQEFFMVMEAKTGKAGREAKAAALEAIHEAMRQGCHPGEVRLVG